MFRLRLQFFLVLLLMSILLTTGLYIFIKVSFQHDFWNYINAKEIRYTQPLAADLIKNYTQQKNWSWIEDWDQYAAQHLDTSNFPRRSRQDNGPPPPSEQNPGEQLPATPPGANNSTERNSHQDDKESRERQEFRDKRDFNRRPPMGGPGIFLLDENKKLVAGKNERRNNVFLMELASDDKIIGYIGIPINPALRDLQDADFVQLQETKLALVITIALVLAGLIAFPLAHFLTKRINQLVAQVGLLSQGQYGERIVVTGRDELSILAEHINNLS